MEMERSARSWSGRRKAKAATRTVIARDLSSLCAKDRKSTRLNSSHGYISYAVFFLKKKNYGETLAGIAARVGRRSPQADILLLTLPLVEVATTFAHRSVPPPSIMMLIPVASD